MPGGPPPVKELLLIADCVENCRWGGGGVGRGGGGGEGGKDIAWVRGWE